jgi:hypothetical protein
MQRRYFLFLASLLPPALFAPRFLSARRNQMPPRPNLRDETVRLNELATNIRTVADARRFIDAIEELFGDDIPPAWTTESFRSRLAQAEYLTFTDPHKRIPEQQLAAVWNTFLRTVGASDNLQVTAADIHNVRANHFTRGRAMWDRGYRNFWLLPSIFATQSDGTLAPGCRLVESFRILYDLDRFPDNLRRIRESVSKITSSPNLAKQPQNSSTAPQVRAYVTVLPGNTQAGSRYGPVELAARRERSMKALTQTIETVFNTVLNA